MKNRGFEKLSCIKYDLPLPKRGTKNSAGYDICVICPETYYFLTMGFDLETAWEMTKARTVRDTNGVVLPTGIKAYMKNDEYLQIHIRSSVGIKRGIRLSNSTGIIDSDYYNNKDNEGHIMVGITAKELTFEKPIERLCQGIFTKFLVADNDEAKNTREGGIGSTNET